MGEKNGLLLPTLEAIAARYGLADVYVFGSRGAEIAARVRGNLSVESHPGSDIDVAVQPSPGRDLDVRERVRLAAELEDLLGAGSVDLVLLSEASAYLALDVIRGELLLTADPHAQAESTNCTYSAGRGISRRTSRSDAA